MSNDPIKKEYVKSVDGTALSIRKNPETNIWELVEIEFNVKNNYSKIKVISLTDSKASAMQAYSIRSVQLRHNVP